MPKKDKLKKILGSIGEVGSVEVINLADPEMGSFLNMLLHSLDEMKEGKLVHLSLFKITPEGIERHDIGGLPDYFVSLALYSMIEEMAGREEGAIIN